MQPVEMRPRRVTAWGCLVGEVLRDVLGHVLDRPLGILGADLDALHLTRVDRTQPSHVRRLRALGA